MKKSNTHKTIHLLAQDKEGSTIKSMQKYKLIEAEGVLKEHGCLNLEGLTVIAVRPHPHEDFWQVETGSGLIWVKESNLQVLEQSQ